MGRIEKIILALLLYISALSSTALAQSASTTLDTSHVVASALLNKDVIFALVRPLAPEELESEKTYLTLSVDKQDNSHVFLRNDLSLALLRNVRVISPAVVLTRVLHIVGVDSGVRYRTVNGEAEVVEAGPVFSDPAVQWLVLLAPAADCAPEACRHMAKFQKKGIQIHTLYYGGRGAYALISDGAGAASEFHKTMRESVLQDITALLTARSRLNTLTEGEREGLKAKMKTETGRSIVSLLSTTVLLEPTRIEGRAATGKSPSSTTAACASGHGACPVSHLTDVATCIPQP